MDPTKLIQYIDSAIAELHAMRQSLGSALGGFPEECMAKLERRICLYCDEPIPPENQVFQGCHEKCQKKIRRQIRAGKLTDAEAIGRGILAPKYITSSGTRDPKLRQIIASTAVKQFAEEEISRRLPKLPGPDSGGKPETREEDLE